MRIRDTIILATLPVLAAIGALTLVGGAGAETKPPPSTCSPNGTALSITANDNKFDKDCMAVPADQGFTIAFDNADRGISHNVAIYDDDHGGKTLFKGEIIAGPDKTTYNVPALPEGRYVFRCDPHPEFMVGNFLVGNPPPVSSETTTTTTGPPATTTTTSGLGLPKLIPLPGS